MVELLEKIEHLWGRWYLWRCALDGKSGYIDVEEHGEPDLSSFVED